MIKRLDRRTVLRGIGSVSIGLPALEIMRPTKAGAVETRPQYFITFYQPNGNVRGRWADGAGSDFTLGTIMAPLERHKSDLILLSGVDNRAASADGPGDDHDAGTACLFTARTAAPGPREGAACHSGRKCGTIGFAGGISIDQEIAGIISKNTRLKSLELGASVSHHARAPVGNIAHSGPNAPLRPIDDPAGAFSRVLSDFTPPRPGSAVEDPALANLRRRRKSLLDAVLPSFEDVKKQVGNQDRQRLDQHVYEIRELERRLEGLAADPAQPRAAVCTLPATDSTQPKKGTSGAHEKIVPYMMDVTAMALACNRTRVVSIMGSHGYSTVRFSWLGHDKGHHAYSHDASSGGRERIVQVNAWYAKQVAYLFDKLKAAGIFQSTIFVYGMELQNGLLHNHNKQDWFMTGGGRFKGGRYLNFLSAADLGKNAPFSEKSYSKLQGKYSANQLFVSCLQAFGAQTNEFGDPRFGTGPITEV